MVFAGIFQLGDVEQAVGGGIEAGLAHQRRQGWLGDPELAVAHQPRVGEAGALGEA